MRLISDILLVYYTYSIILLLDLFVQLVYLRIHIQYVES